MMDEYENLSKEELIKMLSEQKKKNVPQKTKKTQKSAYPENELNLPSNQETTENVCLYVAAKGAKEKCTEKATTPFGFCSKHSRTVQAKKAKDKYEEAELLKDVTTLEKVDEKSSSSEEETVSKIETKRAGKVEIKAGTKSRTNKKAILLNEKQAVKEIPSNKAREGNRKVVQENRVQNKKSDVQKKTVQEPKKTSKKTLNENELATNISTSTRTSKTKSEYPELERKRQEPKSSKKNHEHFESEKLKQTAARVITIYRNRWNRFEETNSHIVFTEDKVAYGIQEPNGRITALKPEHVALCKKNKWYYNLPYDSEESGDDSTVSKTQEDSDTTESSESTSNNDEVVVTSDDSDDSSENESSGSSSKESETEEDEPSSDDSGVVSSSENSY
jgi:hypothetical protein